MATVYYRVYAQDGALRSMKAVLGEDPYLGRIRARDITPPQTITSLKRCLSKFELIGDHSLTDLFMTPSDQSPPPEHERILSIDDRRTGVGSDPESPLSIVAKLTYRERYLRDLQLPEALATMNADGPQAKYCESQTSTTSTVT